MPPLPKIPDKVIKAHPLTPATIKLRQWLIAQNMTVPDLARRTGYNATTLYQYICGRPNFYPSLPQAFAIEYVTNGYVPAWLWLDNPHIEMKVRSSNLVAARRLETNLKQYVLKFDKLKTTDGMLRQKARILSRLFKVQWGEVKARCWKDARKLAQPLKADVFNLLTDDISEEEHNAQG